MWKEIRKILNSNLGKSLDILILEESQKINNNLNNQANNEFLNKVNYKMDNIINKSNLSINGLIEDINQIKNNTQNLKIKNIVKSVQRGVYNNSEDVSLVVNIPISKINPEKCKINIVSRSQSKESKRISNARLKSLATNQIEIYNHLEFDDYSQGYKPYRSYMFQWELVEFY